AGIERAPSGRGGGASGCRAHVVRNFAQIEFIPQAWWAKPPLLRAQLAVAEVLAEAEVSLARVDFQIDLGIGFVPVDPDEAEIVGPEDVAFAVAVGLVLRFVGAIEARRGDVWDFVAAADVHGGDRSEEHTSELQSRVDL